MTTHATTMTALETLKSRKFLLVGLGAAGLLAAFEWRQIHHGEAPPAMAASVVSEREPVIHADGRVVAYPGAQVVVGTDVGGRLRNLPVSEKMRVKKGDLIAEIDADEQKAALAEARQRVAEAEVDMKYFDSEHVRSQTLLASNAIAAAAADRTVHERDGARARHSVALATAQRLLSVVAKSRITAPIDGVVVLREHEQGETIAAGSDLVTIANLDKVRIEAEVDEYDAGRIALGALVTVSAEGYGNASWKGRVEEIPDTVTSRRLKPEDPARPSDTRVLLVKVALEGLVPVKLGQRVEVQIQASGAR